MLFCLLLKALGFPGLPSGSCRASLELHQTSLRKALVTLLSPQQAPWTGGRAEKTAEAVCFGEEGQLFDDLEQGFS